jgi:hypothetical protein
MLSSILLAYFTWAGNTEEGLGGTAARPRKIIITEPRPAAVPARPEI